MPVGSGWIFSTPLGPKFENMQVLQIRRYCEADFESLVAMWHTSKRAAFPYVATQQRYTLEDDRDYFQRTVRPEAKVWIAEKDGVLLGFVALVGDLIDLLFVAVQAQCQGIGHVLTNRAKERSPGKLRAYTFQKNRAARSFFAKQGFEEIGFGVSPPPEDEPDVELLWRPGKYR